MSTYTISEVATRTGFSTPTLRYYEQIGLIPRPERTEVGYRVFTEEHLRILDFIGRAKRLGLPLEEIAVLAEAWAKRDCRATREQLERLVETKLTQVRHLIGDLIRFRDQLEEVHLELTDRPAPRRCGPDCGCEIEVNTIDRDEVRVLSLVSLSPTHG
ncbi:MAG TPA: MerR family transcriptional regulator [Actinomycetota bacterium]|jgi:DNA-binding transcriptional MerR regulator|nr:MerR family transcriptional regulator [Actinomycetota bacterium]